MMERKHTLDGSSITRLDCLSRAITMWKNGIFTRCFWTRIGWYVAYGDRQTFSPLMASRNVFLSIRIEVDAITQPERPFLSVLDLADHRSMAYQRNGRRLRILRTFHFIQDDSDERDSNNKHCGWMEEKRDEKRYELSEKLNADTKENINS
jgi:hypothetical protein